MADWNGWILLACGGIVLAVVAAFIVVVACVLRACRDAAEKSAELLRMFANHALSVSESGLDLRRIDADERRNELTERTPPKRVATTEQPSMLDTTIEERLGYGP